MNMVMVSIAVMKWYYKMTNMIMMNIVVMKWYYKMMNMVNLLLMK